MYVFRNTDVVHSGWLQDGFVGDTTVSIFQDGHQLP